ncbi:MAG TPA: cobalamin B12-binding domain-containing protein, partial [Opitutaceae bacterium]|nr:cobalamin B12-binding domain-containing protein [Opitutaceae bacterium]
QKRLQEMAWAVGSVGGDHAVHEEPASLIFINKLDRALQAVRQLDSVTLGEVLREAEIELGPQGVLQRVIAPLMQMIGEQWREGLITAAHEHFASAVIRIFLGHAARPFAASPDAPVLTVATPTGQLHELGALLVGAYAANLGWKVVYLGASLGAADIAGASLQNRTQALALSLVYPDDDPQLGAELVRLREALPGVPIIAGGRAVSSYLTALEKIKAINVTDLTSFGRVLDGLRKRGTGGLAATSLGSG